ncbi:MAG: DUF2007 domain-containing protein, partial [Dehalococcoidia bacterium]|nr:DUF2007 domain-containing protein [Dehalococcoidia bacterium]
LPLSRLWRERGIQGVRVYCMPAHLRLAYLTTAPDQLTAEMWQELLRSEGIPAVIRASDTASYLGVSSSPCRLMVPQERLPEARRLLEEHLGPEALT